MARDKHQSGKTGGDQLALGTQLCFALYSTMLGVNKVYRRLLGGLDITYPQYLVMLVLWERDNVNVSEICERLYLETTTLTPLLKRLETRGLVRRQRSLKDERQVIVSLTREGAALRAKAVGIPRDVGETLGCSLPEVAALRDQLVKVRATLFRDGA